MKEADAVKCLTTVLLLALLAACAPPPKGEGGANVPIQRAKTLVFGRGGDSVSLDPAHEDDGESLAPCEMIYDTLVQFKEGTTEVEPGLADRYEVSDDGLSYTFHLHPDVKFHDGTPCDAVAVVFSFERQRDPEHPFHKLGGAYKYWGNMGMSDIVAKVEAVDPLTVKFTLKRPEAPFLANLAMHFCSIVSPAAVRKWGEDYGRHPTGTGPFKFASWDPRQKIVLAKNPGYFKGAPEIDKLIYRVIPEANTRLMELKGGSIQGFDNPSPFQLKAVENDPVISVLTKPGMNVGYLAMNCRKKPFDDIRVRQAVAHAIDKQAIIADLYQGMGVAAKNPLPPSVWGYDDTVEDYPYDPAKAKELLDAAGVSDGFETTLYAMPNPRPYMPSPEKVAEAIIADLAKVGIRAKMVTYDWATYLAKTEAGEHDMALLGWSGDNGDPDNFLYVLLSKEATNPPATNIAFWEDDDFSTLVKQAKQETDKAKRADLYRQAQQIFHRETPWVPLAHSVQVILMSKRVRGFTLYPTTRKDFRKVTLAD